MYSGDMFCLLLGSDKNQKSTAIKSLRACAKSENSHNPAHAQSHPCLCSLFIYSVVSKDFVSGQ